jgi:putative nucleotidyltransferase with HDIG domain
MKELVKKILLRLLIWTERKPSKPVVRERVSFFNREIHLPASVIVTVNMLIVFASLVLEIGPEFKKLIGLFLFMIVSFCIFVLFFIKYLKDLSNDNDAIMLFGILFCVSLLLIETSKSVSGISPFLVPISGMCLLISLLLGEKAGILFSISISFISGLLYQFKLEYLFYHFFSGLFAVVLAEKIKHRQDVTYAGFKIAIINVLSILILTFLGNLEPSKLFTNLAWAFGNGIFSAVLVLGLLSPLELFFSRITNIKLLELADFNQPLLKKLMIEAPGTYHHSLIVASLAQHSAEAIGANSLLVRVGAFYHDIGKLIKPEYFIENQIAMENPHDFIQPSMSGLVVISHVKEGVTLARENNLDKPIIDLIEQHHGTSLMYSFYQKALQNVEDAKEDSFRYPGPKPKTKEAAILMLADSCEAAVRSIENPSPGRIKDMVEKVINNKFTDGQLDESPLSLSDLHKIAESMVNILTGIHHPRIEYEQQEKE